MAQLDQSDLYRRFVRNASMILGSRLVFGLLNLGTNVLIARAFGLADLGVVLLLQSYTRLFSDIVKFQSWQAVLRFGAVANEAGDRRALRRLLGLTLGVDAAGFAIAVTGAVLLTPWAADLFEWTGPVAEFAPLFALSIIFITPATSNGVLRLYDRVDVLATQFALNAVLRLIGVGWAFLAGGDLVHVVLAWFCASVISGLLPMVVATRELHRRRLLPSFRVSWLKAGREFPGLWRFLWFTNISSSIALTLNHVATVLVGATLGAAEAATFQIARQLASAIARPARMLGPLLFPEFSVMAARQDWKALRRVLSKQLKVTALVIGGITLVAFVVLGPLVNVLFGPQLLNDLWLFRMLIFGSVFTVIGFALEPAFYSAGRAGTALALQFVAMLLFYGVLWVWLDTWRLDAVGAATLAYQVFHMTSLALIGRRILNRRVRALRPPPASGSD